MARLAGDVSLPRAKSPPSLRILVRYHDNAIRVFGPLRQQPIERADFGRAQRYLDRVSGAARLSIVVQNTFYLTTQKTAFTLA